MKKIISMAFIAMMVAFAATSCSKDDSKEPDDPQHDNPEVTDTITVNPIVNTFNLGKDQLGKTHEEIANMLKSKGYEDYGTVMMYMGESYCIEVIDSTNSQGKVFNLTLTIYPNNSGSGEYKPMLTMSYAYDAVKKIGNQFNMGSHQLRYWGTYNQVGTRMASSYEEFIKYINSGNFNQNNSIWIDSTISHYNAEAWDEFIGLQLHSKEYKVSGSDVKEFSFPINFIDNSLKD